MKYPILSELNTSREWLDVFKGYNHNLRIGEGEFYEMTNLSSDDFPILSPRKKRGIYKKQSELHGIVAKDVLCYIDGSDIVIGEDRISMGLAVYKDEDGYNIPKILISMGAYLIILPDKKYINTKDYDDSGDIEAIYTNEIPDVNSYEQVKVCLCRENGTLYSNLVRDTVPPEITDEMKEQAKENPSIIPFWMDTGGTTALKRYSISEDSWFTVQSTYVRIESPGIGAKFSIGDAVTMEGFMGGVPDGLAVIQAKDDSKDDNGHPKSDWIVIRGIIDIDLLLDSPVKISRKMPDLDFITESGNRLWGCRYGEQDGKTVNEIYASKLGDFKNWNCFEGISTDSWAASVGTDGPFTGATTYLGNPIFFKEKCMHKVYGNSLPFGIQTTACRGVQEGGGRSLAIVNEVLYYKARSGICAYDGSLPEEISAAFGGVTYHGAIGGALENKYYVSMADEREERHLFVFDTKTGMWHREDNVNVMDFCNFRGDLYFIDKVRGLISTVKGTGYPEDAPIKWEAVTGIIGTDSPDKKYISRMDVRMSLSVGARVSFYAEYDSSGEWEYLFATPDEVKLRTFAVPIRPQRCDHLRLKIIGTGEAKIFSICKTIEGGSDV